ncbi:hypothetical protein TruAng_001556 [Truncatella angustata]|nr:hypothetical protein TruAng_001556 [Truncatella angustata]
MANGKVSNAQPEDGRTIPGLALYHVHISVLSILNYGEIHGGAWPIYQGGDLAPLGGIPACKSSSGLASTSTIVPIADTPAKVPSMSVQGRPEALTNSQAISYWFCELYPKLLPKAHREVIEVLLGQLHSIEGLSLSAPRPEDPQEDNVDPACDNLLARTGISDEYRRALEYKKEVDRGHMLKALYHENIDRAEDQARVFFENIIKECKFESDGREWLFGDIVGPTVLDGHVIPFVARLVESGREALVPDTVLDYAQRIVKTHPAWLEVTHGRRTSWDVSYGHVHLLEKI